MPETDRFTALKQKLAKKEPLLISFFGDSISTFEGFDGYCGGATCRAANYAEVFLTRLSDVYEHDGIVGCCHGFPGNNTYMGLGRLHLLKAATPDLVVVAFGANDFGHRPICATQTGFALELILDGVANELHAAAIVMAASSGGPLWDQWDDVAPRIASQVAVCEEWGVPFVDTHAEVVRRMSRGESWCDYFPCDADSHPNDRGHALWAETLLEVFVSRMASDH